MIQEARPGTSSRTTTRTKGQFIGSPLSFFRMHWDQEPSGLVGRDVPIAPLAETGGGALGETRPTLRFMEREHLQKLDVSWGHEPGRRLQSGTGFQPVSPEQARCLCHFLRFMERLVVPLQLSDARSVTGPAHTSCHAGAARSPGPRSAAACPPRSCGRSCPPARPRSPQS